MIGISPAAGYDPLSVVRGYQSTSRDTKPSVPRGGLLTPAAPSTSASPRTATPRVSPALRNAPAESGAAPVQPPRVVPPRIDPIPAGVPRIRPAPGAPATSAPAPAAPLPAAAGTTPTPATGAAAAQPQPSVADVQAALQQFLSTMRPATAGASPEGAGITYGSLQGIDPANDLRSQQINPEMSQDTAAARSAVSQFLKSLQGFQGFQGEAINPTAGAGVADANAAAGRLLDQAARTGTFHGADVDPSMAADTTAARASILAALKAAQDGPDYGKVAADQLEMLERQSDPAYQAELRKVGQLNAAMGRMGAGIVNSQLGDVVQNREQMLTDARTQLADTAAARQVADRLNILGAAEGATGQLFGMDQAIQDAARQERAYRLGESQSNFGNSLNLANAQAARSGQLFGQNQAIQDAARQERAYQTGLNAQNFSQLLGKQQAAQSAYDQLDTADRTSRNELRGEREYQAGQAQTALDNRVRAAEMWDQLQSSALNRTLSQDQLNLARAGLMLQGAGQVGGQQNDAMNLLAQWMMQKYGTAAGGAGATGAGIPVPAGSGGFA